MNFSPFSPDFELDFPPLVRGASMDANGNAAPMESLVQDISELSTENNTDANAKADTTVKLETNAELLSLSTDLAATASSYHALTARLAPLLASAPAARSKIECYTRYTMSLDHYPPTWQHRIAAWVKRAEQEIAEYQKLTADIAALRWVLGQKADAYAQAYNRIHCPLVCEAVLTKLPRELRDMVYEELVGGTAVYRPNYQWDDQGECTFWPDSMERSMKNRDKVFECERAVYKRSLGKRVPKVEAAVEQARRADTSRHIWDPSIVPRSFVVELTETWYRTSLFSENHPHGMNLGPFLKADPWGLNISPSRLINNLHLEVCGRAPGSRRNNSDPPRGAAPQDFVDYVLPELLELKQGVKIFISIATEYYRDLDLRLEYNNDQRNKDIEGTVVRMAPVLRALDQLQDHGHRVSVYVEHRKMDKKVGFGLEEWIQCLEEKTCAEWSAPGVTVGKSELLGGMFRVKFSLFPEGDKMDGTVDQLLGA
jgi:hypothetical protein